MSCCFHIHEWIYGISKVGFSSFLPERGDFFFLTGKLERSFDRKITFVLKYILKAVIKSSEIAVLFPSAL